MVIEEAYQAGLEKLGLITHEMAEARRIPDLRIDPAFAWQVLYAVVVALGETE